jgi:cytochrome c553
MSLRVVVLLFAVATSGVEAANRDDGETLSLACQACHVTPNRDSKVPHLVGQRKGYLAKQLDAFRSGDRKDDLMNAIAKQLSDDDIGRLAAYWSSEPVGSDLVVPAAATPIRQSRMPFPSDFPKGYVYYNELFDADSKTVAKVYANTAATEAARAHKSLPDGSIILTVVYKVPLDAQGAPTRNADGTYATGELVNYSGMEARAGWGDDIPELLRNGTWNYGVFAADKTPKGEINQAFCLACHKPQAASSYVFTLEKLSR